MQSLPPSALHALHMARLSIASVITCRKQGDGQAAYAQDFKSCTHNPGNQLTFANAAELMQKHTENLIPSRILENHPDHGYILLSACMHLILSSVFIQLSIIDDIRTHLCWHMRGIAMRTYLPRLLYNFQAPRYSSLAS